MNLQGIWSGGAVAAPHVEGSLLSDWNSYRDKDLEAGNGSNSAQATPQDLLKQAESAGTSAKTWFQGQANVISGHASTAWGTLPTSDFSIPSSQQLAYMFTFLAAGFVLLLLAFMLFLPIIVLSPSKFALSFTLGCLFIMAGFSQLRGWKQQVAHMFSQERLMFTATYLGSILSTLYAALFMHSYILSLVCSGLQVVALAYYLLSYFPGGEQGVRFVLGMMYNACWGCLQSVQKMVLG
ncbi:Got1/Sft2-like family-domain-containing protein [Dunaliella salina]|uniref:Vesicle transport protein n=1 Tax=Dunaliella salina TaxID=3046 RepID=A0ABQ7GS55_DUNSA|nr:Got1/Sft2-like family-domain-containing protein [Dunaliella salina]|eukprot:KAF5837407.1 Got1/Sft2-like family-domain-containing protein [Dunaliella salina]